MQHRIQTVLFIAQKIANLFYENNGEATFSEYEITIGRAHYLPRYYEGTRYCTYFPIVLKLTHPRKCLRSSHELTILPSLSLSFQ